MMAHAVGGVDVVATLLLAHTPASVAAARRRLTDDLRSRAVRRRVVDDAALVLSELLSNAVRHARPLDSGRLRVAWGLDSDCVVIAVTDGGGATRPHPATPSMSSPGGRGLAIVTSLARWGVRRDGAESTVWASLAFAGRPAGVFTSTVN